MNRSILALCAWLTIALAVLAAAVDDPGEVVCIAAQSIGFDGSHHIDATSCFEVSP